jgi:hypothetical protein
MCKDTRHKIYTGSSRQGGEPYILFGGIKYGALRLVLFPGGIVDVFLGTRPSFI